MSQHNPFFSCSACGRKFPWKAESAGKKGKCKCGQVLVVPAEAEQADLELAAIEGAAASEAAASPAGCPGCGQPMEPGAVLCLNCGYNTRTGGQITTEVGGGKARPAKASAAPASQATETMYTGRRKRTPVEKESAGSTKMYVILGGALLLVAMGVGGWIIFQGTGGGKANVPRLGDDSKVEEMIERETATDLGKWIKANPARMLAGKTPGQAVALEERLKGMGAKRVMAFGTGVMCLSIGIELPQDPAQRKEVFEWCNRNRQSTDPAKQDVGQRYVLHFTGL